MSTIPTYPSPPGNLADSDLVLGFSGGKTVSVPANLLSAYVVATIIPQMLEMLASACSGMVDVNGGAPPAGPAFYFDGGALKFIAGD